ncbi:MAG: ImmA/IrrE family metallo-endopeptidase [Fimbriimonadaceae bacterium]|nr:hypothetical protein [Fimbriimonadaceae bacterium]MCL4284701.1 ImmA/IrrE family metallo-endopeptidase [Fimbriimonadaceae bacterium]QOJ12477.1 MAG: ImmA/IrrE family metallo-endopeptidase [Chthonomonadaceae bacterium]RIK01354.1 MAG: hypothetical protein DCC46_02050 [Armatimonadota bacterium]
MRVPILSNPTIGEIAARLLQEHGLEATLPVDVEVLIERDLKLDIVPLPGFGVRGIDGLLSQDRTTIYVDESIQRNVATRYRFTLAHELGHSVLHSDLIESHLQETGDKPLMLWETLSEDEYRHAERQANVFAANLLMPALHLEAQFQAVSERLATAGKTFDVLDSFAKMKVLRAMSSIFVVSPDALRIRLIREGLISDFENPEKDPRA